jgi:EmrB/QacA subfamily drug resistance transporter
VQKAGGGRAGRALVVVLAGMFMALLDTTIVNVALPTIRTNLGTSESALSWIVSGYALAFGLALIPAGRVADRVGHKWVFIVGLSLFTLASVACGFARGGTELIVARAVQGFAGGIFVPPVTAFIQLLFTGRERRKAFSAMGAVIGFSTAVGPILGGLIIQAFGTTIGWRLVFWVNLPIGVATLIGAFLVLPATTSGAARADGAARAGVDGVGLGLLSAGLVALLVPLVEGYSDGWPAWTYLCLAAGVLLLVGFGAWEVAFSRRGQTPLVEPGLFAHPAFSGGVVLGLVYFASFTSIFFTLSLLWQAGLGHTALASGLVSVPFAVGSIIGSSQNHKVTERLGRGVLVLGAALFCVGLVVVWLILVRSDGSNLTGWELALPLLVAGFGNGFFISPNVQFVVATVARSQVGAASGVVNTAQRVGGAIGIAVIGSVLFGTLHVSGPGPAALAAAFTHSAAHAMAVNVLLALVALVLVFALPRTTSGQGPGAAEGPGHDSVQPAA